MIRAWIADITGLLDEGKYRFYYEKVPAWRKEKADCMAMQQDRIRSIGAWTLLEKARGICGAGENTAYNLSHSGKYVLCAFDDRETQGGMAKVGCDIQEMKQLRGNIAKRFFCESEYAYINSVGSGSEREEAFYRYWVLKESFMKATRLGMKLGLDEFEIIIREDNTPELIKQPDRIRGNYYYQEYEIEQEPYKAAVCASTKNISSKLEILDL